MKIAWTFCLMIAVANFAVAQQGKQQTPPVKKQEKKEQDPQKTIDQASFMMGQRIALDLKEAGVAINLEQFAKGYAQGNKQGTKIDPAEFRAVMMKFNQLVAAKMADKNAREGAAFMKKNKLVEGVIQTESGLQYKQLKAGKGKSPSSTDIVKINYKGTYPDGKVFDQTSKGRPATLAVNQFIKGFSEGLQKMTVGSKYQFVIPGNIGYGMNPPPGSGIPLNKTLVFEVELLEIVNPGGNQLPNRGGRIR